MGLPAEGIEGMYRNNINDVAAFLDERHKDHYLVFNLTAEYTYDIQKFHNNVEHFGFPDHHPPQLHQLFNICETIDKWMKKDPKNVVAIHRKAGKGRTGLVICCYLLYSGVYKYPADAITFFAYMRAQNQTGGVAVPSQVRYVHYFSSIVTRTITPSQQPLKISMIVMQSVPEATSDKGICPYFQIMQQDKLLYDSRIDPKTHKPRPQPPHYYRQVDEMILLPCNVVVY